MKFLKEHKKFIAEKRAEMIIPDIIWELNSLFKKNDHSLYLVGGSVRDFLTGETPKDYDLATDATPDEMVSFLKDKYKLNLQGANFGVVVIYHPSQEEGIEIASFQTRHKGETVVGATIEDDVERRDLTFNALFYDLDKKEVVDLVGGSQDLEDRVVKTVGDPADRIEEDPLRILRVFRFATRYESKISDKVKDAIHSLKHLIKEPTVERDKGVSQERIVEEFTKSFKQAKRFKDYLDYISEFDLWSIIFDGMQTPDLSDYVETDRFDLAVAQVFEGQPIKFFSGRKAKMVTDWGFARDLSDTVRFLLMFKDFDVDKVLNLKKEQSRIRISDDTINQWMKIESLSGDKYQKFLEFDPSVITAKDIDLPPGPELGKEIQKRRLELFKSL